MTTTTAVSVSAEAGLVSSSCLQRASTAERTFRRRLDLIVQEQCCSDGRYFVIKDPVSSATYRFAEREYKIFNQLDGRSSASNIGRKLKGLFGGVEEATAEVQRFIDRLVPAGLVIPAGTGNSTRLLQQEETARSRRRIGWLNILYIKLPAFDPERLLVLLHLKLKWIFEPAGVTAALLLCLAALGLILTHPGEFASRANLQSFQAHLTVANIGWLWLVLGTSKILHEFGHALACRHFGGECHEMGMVVMMFTPCLYCDVSDAWTFPNKWHRILVSSAGIYVEVVIASLATLIWWKTSPGVIHSIAFMSMVVCSANTLLVNANPLMRFDGYYVLSDFLEIPNLRQKAQQGFQRWLVRSLGLTPASARNAAVAHQGAFVLYSVLATVYRWFLVVLILWGLHHLLKPYGLASVSMVLAGIAAALMIVMPLVTTSKLLMEAVRRSPSVRWTRLGATTVVAAAAGAAVVFVPFPRNVSAVFTLEPPAMTPVFAPVSGTLVAVDITDGQVVRAGDRLAVLKNSSVEMEVAHLEYEINRLNIDAERLLSADQPGERQRVLNLIDGMSNQLQTRRDQLAQLTLHAAREGIVAFQPQSTMSEILTSPEQQLPRWGGAPLLPENLGCLIAAGTPVCEIHPLPVNEAVLIVEQADLEFVSVGQRCSIQLDAVPGVAFHGTVVEIARRESFDAPRQLSRDGGGSLASLRDASGVDRLVSPHYRVRIRLGTEVDFGGHELREVLVPGFRGRARIHAGEWTCWQYLSRKLHGLLRL